MNLIKCLSVFLCLFYFTNVQSQVTVNVSNLKSNGVSVTNNTVNFKGAKEVTLDLNVDLTTLDGNLNNTLGNLFLYFKPTSTDLPIQVGFRSVTFIANYPPFVSQTTYTSSISFSSIKLLSSNFFATGGVFYAEYRNNNNKAFQSSNISISGGIKVLPGTRFIPPVEDNTICCNQTIRFGDKPAILNGTKLSRNLFESPDGLKYINGIGWLKGDDTNILNNPMDNSYESYESDYLFETTVFRRENNYHGFKPLISNLVTITVVPSPIIANTISTRAPVMADGSYDVVENVEFSGLFSKVNLNVLNNPFHIVQRNDNYKDVVDYQWQFKLDGNNKKWTDIPSGKGGLINFSLKMVSNKFVNFYYVRRIAKYQNISKVSNVLKILNRKTSVTNTICCSQKLEFKSSEFSLPSVLVGSTPVFSVIDAVGFDSQNNPPINIKLLSYQWQKSDSSRSIVSWENIVGANSKDYLPEKITSGGTPINYRRVVKFKYQNIGYYTSGNKPVYVDKFYETYSNIANLYSSRGYYRKYADVEDELDENFKIYPNPVNSILNILGSSSLESYKIYSSTGQEMELKRIISGDNSISIDVSSLSNGIYYISFEKDAEVIVKKFIKQ